jgi:adenylate cyclase
MKGKRKRLSKKIAAPLIAALVFGGTLLLHFSGALNYPEYKTYDFRVNLLANYSRPSDDIIVILLDQASIDWAAAERGWGWPWPRKAYAEFVEYMSLAGAKSVAFDVIFSEPSVYRNSRQDEIISKAVENLRQSQALMGEGRFREGGSYFRGIIGALRELSNYEDDASFAQAEQESGRVVQTVFLSFDSGTTAVWPEDLDKPLFELSGFDDLLPEYKKLSGRSGEGTVLAQFPIESLRNNAGIIGSVTGWPDSDDIFRRANLFTLFDGKAVPGLGPASLLVSGHDNKLVYDSEKKLVRWGAYSIPVDDRGRSILNFRGELERYIPYGMSEILQSAESHARGEEALLPPENFKDKYVFFGFFAPGLYDRFSSPISSNYPGVGVHITMLDNILNQDFIRESPVWIGLLIIFTVIVLAGILSLYQSRIGLTVAGTILLFLLVFGFGLFAYAKFNLWVPLVAPTAGLVLAFLTTSLYNYATEGSQKRFIKSAFSQYLSPTVIDQLLADPSLLTLGGERREISIFFSDVQGFTSISEQLDPVRLTELLNDYLTFMTDTILDSGGTIDKYEGDAIIAFWNAPVSFEDHAARALEASMLCQKKLAERQDFFAETYGCRLLTRIGLNTGYAVVGNMGSGKRFNYTMLGDSVNLAARLEGLNKQFGTWLICTEATFAQAQKAAERSGKDAGVPRPFYGRRLAQVAVVGKKEAVTVYEPMTEEEFRRREESLRAFERARNLFYQGSFAEALPLFEALADQDRPSFFYTEQCRYYAERPAEWQGFWQAKSK